MTVSRGTRIWLAAAGVFAAVAAGAFYVAWPLLNPTVVATAPLDPGCDLRQGPCTGTLPNGATVRFGLEPRTIPLLEPLAIDVRVGGMRALGVQVDFAGVDMNMGYNRPSLSPEGEGRYVGKAVLPVCVRYRMDWVARVLVRTAEGLMAVPFRFSTFKGAPPAQGG
jgi:hypothetical protein